MNKKLYILGAGGFAREIYSYLSATNYEYEGHVFAGFLTDFETDLDGYHCEHEIVGPIRNADLDDVVLIMGVSDCAFKRELYDFYKALGVKFISYIHPSVFIGRNVKVGYGSVICPNTVLSSDIRIGAFATINMQATIAHDVKVGDFCTISPQSNINGWVEIADAVLIGTNATILPKVLINSKSIIGPGTVVYKTVKSETTVFGNPARSIKNS